MKKIVLICWAVIVLLMTAGCNGSSGPDKDALPPLETTPSTTGTSGQAYERGDSILIYQETLSSGLNFELYEDGKLVLSGGDITVSIGDEKRSKIIVIALQQLSWDRMWSLLATNRLLGLIKCRS